MSAACPECVRMNGPGIARRLVLPGDRRSDEIALEVLACACGFKAIAVAEQSRQTSLRSAASERVGYRLPSAAVDLLAFLIARCPQPAEEYCPCPAHAALNRRDLRNQWNLLYSFAPFDGFAVPPALGQATADPRLDFAYAPLDWARNGDGYRAVVERRDWQVRFLEPPDGPRYELSIDEAIGFEFDAWPPFWRVRESERGGGETGRSK